MKTWVQLRFGVFLMSVVSILAGEEPELPLCPTNIQYFPQNLPMHCRMPPQSQQMQFIFQNPPGKEGQPIPIPIPPFPGAPGQMPAPGPPPGIGIGSIPPLPGPFPGPMPGMPGALPGTFPGLPVPPPGPVPMPMPVPGGPPHKLPVIVMPFYSPDGSYKKRITTKPPKKKKKHRDSSYSSDDADSGSSDSSDERSWWKTDRKKRKKKYYDMYRRLNKVRNAKLKRRTNGERLLTPVLQYVTKDGYVIFEKQISNGEAKDWLRTNDRKDVKEDRNEDKITENNKPKQETPRQLPHKEENISTMEDSEERQGYEKMTKSPEGVKEFTFRRRPPKKRHIHK